MSGAESLSDPACDVGCEVVEASIPRGGADPTRNQLSGAVGGRASGALISIVKASLRAVFRGGSFVDGCGTAAQTALCGDASGCCGEWLAARCDGENLVSSHTKGLCSGET